MYDWQLVLLSTYIPLSDVGKYHWTASHVHGWFDATVRDLPCLTLSVLNLKRNSLTLTELDQEVCVAEEKSCADSVDWLWPPNSDQLIYESPKAN